MKLTTERIKEIAAPLDLPMEIEIFARAVEYEAHCNGEASMRERAAGKCRMLATMKGNDCFGDAVECGIEIRALEIEGPKPVPCGEETDPFNPCGLVRETSRAGK